MLKICVEADGVFIIHSLRHLVAKHCVIRAQTQDVDKYICTREVEFLTQAA